MLNGVKISSLHKLVLLFQVKFCNLEKKKYINNTQHTNKDFKNYWAVLCFWLGLTDKHAKTHSAHGNDAGDLKSPTTLWAHQTVSSLQAAWGTFAPWAFCLCLLEPLGLSLLCVRVLFVPLLTLTSPHDFSFLLVFFDKGRAEQKPTDGLALWRKWQECNSVCVARLRYSWGFTGNDMSRIMCSLPHSWAFTMQALFTTTASRVHFHKVVI